LAARFHVDLMGELTTLARSPSQIKKVNLKRRRKRKQKEKRWGRKSQDMVP